jgi:hypothetical protein
MSNLPVEFRTTDIVQNASLHFSYTFDNITSVEASNGTMPFHQDYLIDALKINLAGRTSNPNMSVSIDSNTRLFTLNTCYITDIYPHMKDELTKLSFVIEGFSNENVDRERVLIYLPMTQATDTANLFYPLEKAILENKKIEKGLDLNTFIPSTSLDTDSFTYFKYTDYDEYIYHVIYYKQSALKHTAALVVPKNTAPYTSTDQLLNYKTTTLAKHHDSMTNHFEDNIYIDCVPVDYANRKQEKYLKIDKKYAKNFKNFMVYLSYIIILTLVVYGIYYFYIYMTATKPPSSLK